jgi:hypothetical protein
VAKQQICDVLDNAAHRPSSSSEQPICVWFLQLLCGLLLLLQVEHRNKAGGQRLKSLCQSATKRFYVFSNEHHKCVCQSGTAVQQCM